MRWDGHVARIGKTRNTTHHTHILVGGPEGKPKHRWKDNIKMDLKEIFVRMWSV
jgi:hypothetical protein